MARSEQDERMVEKNGDVMKTYQTPNLRNAGQASRLIQGAPNGGIDQGMTVGLKSSVHNGIEEPAVVAIGSASRLIQANQGSGLDGGPVNQNKDKPLFIAD
jgi:hypothetical protein